MEIITKSFKKLRNKLISFSEFIQEHDKFMNNFKVLKDYKDKKEKGSFSPNQKKK